MPDKVKFKGETFMGIILEEVSEVDQFAKEARKRHFERDDRRIQSGIIESLKNKNMPYFKITPSTLKEIVRLSGKSINELRKINNRNERGFACKKLTKYELIFQIVFLRDSPNEK